MSPGARPITQVFASAVEELAQHLAGESGIAWCTLSSYPGYHKTLWRERARAILSAAGLEVMENGEAGVQAARAAVHILAPRTPQ